MLDSHVKIIKRLDKTNTKKYHYVKGRRRNLNVNEIASLGSNVKPVIQNENCAVLMLNDATGEGVMTVYRVMPGVMICFSDMHMEQCASEFELKNDRKIFCIDHCREGRYLACFILQYLPSVLFSWFPAS